MCSMVVVDTTAIAAPGPDGFLITLSMGWRAAMRAPATGGGGICCRRERESVSLEVVSTAPVAVFIVIIILVLILRRIGCYPVHRDECAELGAERRRRCEDSDQHHGAETSGRQVYVLVDFGVTRGPEGRWSDHPTGTLELECSRRRRK